MNTRAGNLAQAEMPVDDARNIKRPNMAESLSRRGLLARSGTGLAVAAVGGAGLSRQVRAAEFDWKKHAGKTLRVVTLKFPLSEIQQTRLADFQLLTGMKVQWEMLPEDLWRQKVKVEHLGGATDLDVFLSYFVQEGDQFLASGWYTDTTPMIRDPALTNPNFAWNDYIPTVVGGATVGADHPRPGHLAARAVLPARPVPAIQSGTPENLAGRPQRRQDDLRGHQQASVRHRATRQGRRRHLDVGARPV